MDPHHSAIGLMAVACLLFIVGCAADEPSATSGATASTGASSATPTTPDLAGTWSTPPITPDHMADVARAAGFEPADIEAFRADYAGVSQVVYTVRATDSLWVEFESRDGGPAEEGWTGPYEVLDPSTMRAGEKPCGPITYDFSLAGDELTLAMTDNQCLGPDGTVAAGELIAQTTIYESAPFHRLG